MTILYTTTFGGLAAIALGLWFLSVMRLSGWADRVAGGGCFVCLLAWVFFVAALVSSYAR